MQASRDSVVWSDPRLPNTIKWTRETPLIIFLTGPFVNLLDRRMKTFGGRFTITTTTRKLASSPLSMRCSARAVAPIRSPRDSASSRNNTSPSSQAAILWSCQRGQNWVRPRVWCLACVRDLICPATKAAGDGPPNSESVWPHLRAHRLNELPDAQAAVEGWLYGGSFDLLKPSVLCGRTHTHGHLLRAMRLRKGAESGSRPMPA